MPRSRLARDSGRSGGITPSGIGRAGDICPLAARLRSEKKRKSLITPRNNGLDCCFCAACAWIRKAARIARVRKSRPPSRSVNSCTCDALSARMCGQSATAVTV
jgi:hypothetical protein